MRHFRNKLVRHRLTLLGILAWSLHAPVMAKSQPVKPMQTQDKAADAAPPTPLRHGKKKAFPQVGRASWYGISSTRGLRTASGERFDPEALTGAHPTLPFGTMVKVTNLRNGRSAAVRINDRGPFVGGRIIDVSYAAAHELGMMARGIARVRIEVLPRDRPIAEARADQIAGGLP
ncbi:MAG: rare lipoprotein [Nevskia sp.]|nr:rare lipoprotein [Nevskia sp.]